MIRPTPRAVTLIGLCAPASLALVLFDNFLWSYGLGLLAFSLLLIGLDGLLSPAVRRLEADLKLPPLLYIGENGECRLSLSAGLQRQPVTVEALLDVGEILAPPDRIIAKVEPGAETVATFPLTPVRRGPAEVSRLWLRWTGPLGLMEKSRSDPLERILPVLPNIRPIRDTAVRFSSRDAFFGSKVQRLMGDGSEFDSLRDYSTGMDHRAIDWKHSARHCKLVAKEFHAERNHQIILAFDTGHLMTEPDHNIPKLDHAINAGLLLGYTSLMVGDRVGVFGFDSQVRLYSEPAGSAQAFNRLQQACAQLEYSYEETNFTLGLTDLSARLGRRSLVILYTDFIDTITAELMLENVQRMTRRHLVLFVTLEESSLAGLANLAPEDSRAMTTAVAAHNFLQERRVVLERLRRLGVHCLETSRERLGTDLINRYLTIKRLEQI